MLHRARGTWAALAFGSTVTVGLVFGTVCSVDRAGLSNDDASVSSGGTGGGLLSRGTGGLGSSGGSGSGGAGGQGTGGGTIGGTGGTGGTVGSGGAGGSGVAGGVEQAGGAGGQATGGAAGGVGATGGMATGGDGATGGVGASGGVGGTGGTAGTGDTAGAGGATGTGGAAGTGGPGTGGVFGTGGGPGTGGEIGTGGSGGTGGSQPPSCASFPMGSSFTTPTDGLLHCYWIHTDATDWTSAESRCESEGGTLATILSTQEDMFVLQVLLQANLFKGNGVSLGATDGRSSSDKSGAGQYAWVTGEPWGYINWHAGQPSGMCTCQGLGNTTCSCDHWLAMINDGTWIDVAQSATRPSICEAVAR